MNDYLKPHNLERWSFFWSEARLVIAAVALFIGGVPPLLLLANSSSFSLILLVLQICWIISGLASGYMLYRWMKRKTLFGRKNTLDTAMFAVSVISGLNLGITGVLGRNIGMSIFGSNLVFILTGLVYLAAAIYLYRRWKEYGEKIFS